MLYLISLINNIGQPFYLFYVQRTVGDEERSIVGPQRGPNQPYMWHVAKHERVELVGVLCCNKRHDTHSVIHGEPQSHKLSASRRVNKDGEEIYDDE